MKLKKSILLPAALLIYTLVLAYLGRDMIENGGKIEYLATLGISLLIIVLLHIVLKKKEKTKDKNNKTYNKTKTIWKNNHIIFPY